MVLEKTNAVIDWRSMIGPTDSNKAKVTHPTRCVLCAFVMMVVHGHLTSLLLLALNILFYSMSCLFIPSVRAFCGLDSQRNCVHGSDSPKSAAREISFFFERISSSGQISITIEIK